MLANERAVNGIQGNVIQEKQKERLQVAQPVFVSRGINFGLQSSVINPRRSTSQQNSASALARLSACMYPSIV